MGCVDHLNFLNGTCPDCGFEVDGYGNAEDEIVYCCYPDCGCDGERLCMASEGASERAVKNNKEGMYSDQNPSNRLKAVGDILCKKERGHE